ncbi:MraY family glycosyltransferase [Cupriavidus necator]|uniref:MraY family glycosyltransferase n=1 Tax=Cupriavidus necator TaxID=106590 RepID=UPI001F48F380|nr:MraY family glycosyltransferase [Cupriavidus necator]
MFDFFWVPLFSLLTTALIVLLLRPVAKAGGLVDRPNSRKRHLGEVPLVGGIAVTLAVWAASMLFMRTQGYYVALLGGLTLLALVGVIDDLKGMSPVAKLAAQLLAAILMTSWGGIYLSSLGDLFGRREIELANWGIPLTLFAAVAVINAMNMCDGLDGLAGGLAAIVFGWFAYLAGELGNGAAQRMCIIFCGAILGFLIFNIRNPLRGKSRIFLGDAGSLMLGFSIVWFAVLLSQVQYNEHGRIPPVVDALGAGLRTDRSIHSRGPPGPEGQEPAFRRSDTFASRAAAVWYGTGCYCLGHSGQQRAAGLLRRFRLESRIVRADAFHPLPAARAAAPDDHASRVAFHSHRTSDACADQRA